jgi:hypothetical protein
MSMVITLCGCPWRRVSRSKMNTSAAQTSGTEADTFRKRWIDELEGQLRRYRSGEQSQLSSWEGFEAARELAQTDNLWIVLPNAETNGRPFRHLTDRLFTEVSLYACFRDHIVPTNFYFKDAIDALAAAKAKLKKVRPGAVSSPGEVSGILTRSISAIEKSMAMLKKRSASYWHDALMAMPEERRHWNVYVDDDKQVHSIPPEDLARSEKLFEDAAYPAELVKRIDLDRRFQVRVALILRSYLFRGCGVSLKTIARLVVLTYISGGIGRKLEEYLSIKGRKKPINVSNVDLKLRNARVK